MTIYINAKNKKMSGIGIKGNLELYKNSFKFIFIDFDLDYLTHFSISGIEIHKK